MKCRKSVAQLTAVEKSQLVQAFLDLKDPGKSPSRIPAAQAAVTNGGGTPNRYDDYVWMHNTVGAGAHRGPAFGPWHREFLHQFEFDLQQVSGDPELALPYWDWTTDRSAASAGWPFTNDFMGAFGNAGPGPTTGFITTSQFSDPTKWRINIRRSNDPDLTLKRSRGVPSGSELPTREDVGFALGVDVTAGSVWPSVYDFAPWNDTSGQPGDAHILGSFRKFLERVLHDGIHVWIGDAWDFVGGSPRDGGHMTFPAVAVNDPVFWLHHCNVDRLWSIWQRKAPLSAYVPQPPGTATAGHNGDDLMTNLALQEWFNTTLNGHPNDVQDHQSLGYWYQTDIPEITLVTPSVFFGTVPELSSADMPVMFSVRACQPVTFEITAVLGVNFSEPDQTPVVVDHDHDSDVVTAELDVRFQANGPVGVPQSGTATVVATIVDTDGYDSGTPGAPFVVGTWTVNLRGTPEAAVQPGPVEPGPERPAPVEHDHAEHMPGYATREEPVTMSDARDPDETARAAMPEHDTKHGDHHAGDDHGEHDHGDHDHENMAFTMFRRTESGGLVELQAGDIERDTSDYDDEGHDHGIDADGVTHQ